MHHHQGELQNLPTSILKSLRKPRPYVSPILPDTLCNPSNLDAWVQRSRLGHYQVLAMLTMIISHRYNSFFYPESRWLEKGPVTETPSCISSQQLSSVGRGPCGEVLKPDFSKKICDSLNPFMLVLLQRKSFSPG